MTIMDDMFEQSAGAALDEFTEHRYNELAKGFVEIYGQNKMLAAKMLAEENLPDDVLEGVMRDKISQEFVRQGWTFPDEQQEG